MILACQSINPGSILTQGKQFSTTTKNQQQAGTSKADQGGGQPTQANDQRRSMGRNWRNQGVVLERGNHQDETGFDNRGRPGGQVGFQVCELTRHVGSSTSTGRVNSGYTRLRGNVATSSMVQLLTPSCSPAHPLPIPKELAAPDSDPATALRL
jgi:hypothetical protein